MTAEQVENIVFQVIENLPMDILVLNTSPIPSDRNTALKEIRDLTRKLCGEAAAKERSRQPRYSISFENLEDVMEEAENM